MALTQGSRSVPIPAAMHPYPEVPVLLQELLRTRSPSGYEGEAGAVVDRVLEPVAAAYRTDPLGNRMATLNPGGRPRILLAAHMDEVGLLVNYIDENGYVSFDILGRLDPVTLPGRRVSILTETGPVAGVIGRKSVHQQTRKEQDSVPEPSDLWIDTGAASGESCRQRVRIGDPVVCSHEWERLEGTRITGRALDNKAGCYAACEVFLRLAAAGSHSKASLTVAATVQEEIGVRGAKALAGHLEADIVVALDTCYTTDHPESNPRRLGAFSLGKGPVLTRGPNVDPVRFRELETVARQLGIPYQIEADPRPTGTDGRALQTAGGGRSAAVVSIPLRYMHTPVEVADLADIEQTIRLLTEWISTR